ncbi:MULTISPECIES: PLP-dependent aminotransferase family protein [unclassified Caballeronia]|uniref:aminotransferase-like domain-containing protein n=1 Tax=unclassified Caballeronia TaxID=2646786 RepID=UPI002027B133|nr:MULTISPECIES: PLP-dependent aminotransferase family protein [unclassified Caballeronia]MDR5774817.1 PLP-dependent aminotransferase family protein [Caballeronia sp. LZ002]MDR5850253.1 PLP-dependent aminotransferase family protein [Caballeronia sp. LZ003]
MNQPAHHWIRKLEESRKPAYLTIPDLIEEDLASGRLRPRDRLPGLRDLADVLNLNYTTVARAYAEARKRGLLDLRAGSGTFVRGRTQTLPLAGGSSVEMSMNMPPEPPGLTARLRASAASLMQSADPWQLLRYQDFGGTAADRAAGRAWLRMRLPDCEDDTVLVCPGIHSALVALVSQLARPGEMICLDTLAYPGIKAIASQLGVRLQALPRDDEGPLPHAFEALCKTEKPGGFYCNPTLQNPSTLTISAQRREALADVAMRYNVPIIEDEPYGMLPLDAPAPLAALAPELTYHVTGLSKTFGAGLRVAYLKAPTPRQTQRIAGALRATTVMPSPYTVLLATHWINDGTAADVLDAMREESIARQAIAAQALRDFPYSAHPHGFHLWLPVPDLCDWSASELALQLRNQGIGAVAGAAFSTDGNPPNALRLCLGGPQNREDCREALKRVADMLADPHHLHMPML